MSAPRTRPKRKRKAATPRDRLVLPTIPRSLDVPLESEGEAPDEGDAEGERDEVKPPRSQEGA